MNAEADDSAWLLLDSRAGELFTSRQQLRSFNLSDISSPRCRAFRLRITRTLRPAEANSVQLACWNLYSHPQETSRSMHNPHSASGPLPCDVPGTWDAQLAAALQCFRLESRRFTAPEASGSPRQLLERILQNIAKSPGDAKYRRLRSSKVPGLLNIPSLMRVVWALGFRPVFMSVTEGSAGLTGAAGEDVFLQLDGTRPGLAADVEHALAVMQQLD